MDPLCKKTGTSKGVTLQERHNYHLIKDRTSGRNEQSTLQNALLR